MEDEPGTNDPNPAAGKIDTFMGPLPGVVGITLEIGNALEIRLVD